MTFTNVLETLIIVGM